MDLGPNEVQLALKENARRFLSAVSTPQHVRDMEESRLGFDHDVWAQVCNQGWPGLMIPEEYGGQGGDISDMVVLAEETGRHLLPSPLFASSVLGGATVLAIGSDDQKKDILPGVASGRRILTVAFAEQSGTIDGWGVQATATSGAISGTKLYVPFAAAADDIIVAARNGAGDDGIAFYLVDPKGPGVRVTVLHTIGADHQYAVELNGAQGTLLGPASGAWKAFQGVLDGAAVVLAGEAIGGAERSLELAVEYSKQRVAFGRPIGSFQALQHKMSRAITEITGAQLAVYEAAFRLASGDASAQLDVSLAKAAANMAFSTASIEACHIYGGAGFVRGAEIELFYRRALGSEVTMGTPRWHKKRITKLMAAQSHAAAH